MDNEKKLLRDTEWSEYSLTPAQEIIKLDDLTKDALFIVQNELYDEAAYSAVFELKHMLKRHPTDSLKFGPRLVSKSICSRIKKW